MTSVTFFFFFFCFNFMISIVKLFTSVCANFFHRLKEYPSWIVEGEMGAVNEPLNG